MSTSYFSYTPFWDPTTDSLVALAYDTSNAFVIGRVNVTTGDFKQIAALDPGEDAAWGFYGRALGGEKGEKRAGGVVSFSIVPVCLLPGWQ